MRHDLVEENPGLAHKVAWRFARAGYHWSDAAVSDEDVFGVAYLGLVKAVKGFDLDLGLRFSTYAIPVIQGTLLHFFRTSHPGGLRIPAGDCKTIFACLATAAVRHGM